MSKIVDSALLKSLANQGDADAQFNLGFMYSKGEGVTQDRAEAIRWYLKAAEQGVAIAQNNLGALYNSGEGFYKNSSEAVKWYRKAADQGNVLAQFNLGVMYDKGEGVSEDKIEAVKWYLKAAEQGDANAQNNLGVQYNRGEGVSKDNFEAVRWYRKAVDGGDDKAVRNLEILSAEYEIFPEREQKICSYCGEYGFGEKRKCEYSPSNVCTWMQASPSWEYFCENCGLKIRGGVKNCGNTNSSTKTCVYSIDHPRYLKEVVNGKTFWIFYHTNNHLMVYETDMQVNTILGSVILFFKKGRKFTLKVFNASKVKEGFVKIPKYEHIDPRMIVHKYLGNKQKYLKVLNDNLDSEVGPSVYRVQGFRDSQDERMGKTILNPMSQDIYNKYALESPWAWGIKKSNKSLQIYNGVSAGDIFIFNTKDNRYGYVAFVLDKLDCKSLSDELWGDWSGEYSWELVFSLTEPIEVNINVEEFLRTHNYSSDNIFGMAKVGKETFYAVEREYGSYLKYLEKYNKSSRRIIYSNEKRRSSYPPNDYEISETLEMPLDEAFLDCNLGMCDHEECDFPF